MLTLLTPTGCRPEAWALCQRWMARQTYAGPVRWVVVDDGAKPQPVTFTRPGWTVNVVRPVPAWRDGQNTQARNLRAGLACVPDDAQLVIVEDDDWYARDWLATVARQLQGVDIAGECYARYYNVATRVARQLRNERHASLCATAVAGLGLRALRRLAEQAHQFIDLELWRQALRRRLFVGQRVVGIKGLPGRGGIGVGHGAGFAGRPDPAGLVLRSWIGVDAELYLRPLGALVDHHPGAQRQGVHT
jgi:hypothetical protein